MENFYQESEGKAQAEWEWQGRESGQSPGYLPDDSWEAFTAPPPPPGILCHRRSKTEESTGKTTNTSTSPGRGKAQREESVKWPLEGARTPTQHN